MAEGPGGKTAPDSLLCGGHSVYNRGISYPDFAAADLVADRMEMVRRAEWKSWY